jgi:hypothetical protein
VQVLVSTLIHKLFGANRKAITAVGISDFQHWSGNRFAFGNQRKYAIFAFNN